MPLHPFTLCVCDMGGTTLLECRVPEEYGPSTPLSCIMGVLEEMEREKGEAGSESEESTTSDSEDTQEQEMASVPPLSMRLQLVSPDTLHPIHPCTPLVMIQRVMGETVGSYNVIAQWVSDPRTDEERAQEERIAQGCCLSPSPPPPVPVLSLAGVSLDPYAVIADMSYGHVINTLTTGHDRLVTCVKDKFMQFTPLSDVPAFPHMVCTQQGEFHLVATSGNTLVVYGIRPDTSAESDTEGGHLRWTEVSVSVSADAIAVLAGCDSAVLGHDADGSVIAGGVESGRLHHLLRLSIDHEHVPRLDTVCQLDSALTVGDTHPLTLTSCVDTVVVSTSGQHHYICVETGTVTRSVVQYPQIASPCGPLYMDPDTHGLCVAVYDSTCVSLGISVPTGTLTGSCAIHGHYLYHTMDSGALRSIDMRDLRYIPQLIGVPKESRSQASVPTIPDTVDTASAPLPPSLLVGTGGRVLAITLSTTLDIVSVAEWSPDDAKWGVTLAPTKGAGYIGSSLIPLLEPSAVCIEENVYTCYNNQLLHADIGTLKASRIPYVLSGPVLAHPDGSSLVLQTPTGDRLYRVLPSDSLGEVGMVNTEGGQAVGECVGHTVVNGLVPANGGCYEVQNGVWMPVVTAAKGEEGAHGASPLTTVTSTDHLYELLRSGHAQDVSLGYISVGPALENRCLVHWVVEGTTIPSMRGLMAKHCTFTKCNMGGCDLSGGTLQRCTFTECQMERCHVLGATFIDCVLKDCTLAETDIHSASLVNVSFGGPNLRMIAVETEDVTGLDLTHQDFTGSTLCGCDLSTAAGVTDRLLHTAKSCAGVILEAMDISGWDLSDLDLSHACLAEVQGLTGDMLHATQSVEGIYLQRVPLDGVSFLDLNLRGANLSHTMGLTDRHLREAACVESLTLAGVSLVGADLSGLCLKGSVLPGCDLTGASLRGTDLSHATGVTVQRLSKASCIKRISLKGVDLSKFDLSRVDLSGADLRGCKLLGTRLSGRYIASLCLDTNMEGFDTVYPRRSHMIGAYIGDQDPDVQLRRCREWKDGRQLR
ncbi:hypothetical protein KIPB_005876 [Kipferlia bialata]|uniref:Uncharacterized protein n=1 Tax=Kipferlia bialata TaxID=797122 RepID=A0A9K3CWP6_9EUKA|nr:hypothetical protein KIPB_005876 [Kipferlia bialata]|eukprot:g5876.t1